MGRREPNARAYLGGVGPFAAPKSAAISSGTGEFAPAVPPDFVAARTADGFGVLAVGADGPPGVWAEYLGQPGGVLEGVLVPDWARAAWVRAEENAVALLLELQPSRSATAALAQIPSQVPDDDFLAAAERWRLRHWARWALPETRVTILAESFFRSGLSDLGVDSNFVAQRLDEPVRVEARP